MFCLKCGTENVSDARFCNGCGAAFQAPVIKEPKNGLTSGGAILLLSLIALVATIVIMAASQTSTTEHPKKATVDVDMAPCGSSVGEMAEMVQAARDNDSAGYLALSRRSGNMILSNGTAVEIFDEAEGYDGIRVANGEHRDTICWIPASVLTLDTN